MPDAWEQIREGLLDSEFHEVLVKYAAAMASAQNLESALSTLVFASRILTKAKTERELHALLHDVERAMMGKNLQAVLQEAKVPPVRRRELSKALRDRNRLVHKFFGNEELLTEAGRRRAAAQFDRIHERFDSLASRTAGARRHATQEPPC